MPLEIWCRRFISMWPVGELFASNYTSPRFYYANQAFAYPIYRIQSLGTAMGVDPLRKLFRFCFNSTLNATKWEAWRGLREGGGYNTPVFLFCMCHIVKTDTPWNSIISLYHISMPPSGRGLNDKWNFLGWTSMAATFRNRPLLPNFFAE